MLTWEEPGTQHSKTVVQGPLHDPSPQYSNRQLASGCRARYVQDACLQEVHDNTLTGMYAATGPRGTKHRWADSTRYGNM